MHNTKAERNNYDGFLKKFKPKKTTDDCYTPENVYDVVASYVTERYGIQREQMVRPFWPGGDYERFDYPTDCCVVDNPPFSIISQICNDYLNMGVKFFLFCYYLTSVNPVKRTKMNTQLIVAPANIMYENGADIPTSFITNMEPGIVVRSDPELYKRLKAADAVNRANRTADLPKYEYPDDILTVAKAGYFAAHDTPYTLRKEDCCIISQMDQQKQMGGKTIFGSGFLLSEKAAAEKAAAEKAAAEKAAATRWQLSDRERKIQAMLGKKS